MLCINASLGTKGGGGKGGAVWAHFNLTGLGEHNNYTVYELPLLTVKSIEEGRAASSGPHKKI